MIIVDQIVTHSLVSIEKNVAVAIAIGINGQVLETLGSLMNLSVPVHVQVTQALNVVELVDTLRIGRTYMKLMQLQHILDATSTMALQLC